MILIEIDCLIKALYLGVSSDHITPDERFYEANFFGKFRKLKWLGLSDNTY